MKPDSLSYAIKLTLSLEVCIFFSYSFTPTSFVKCPSVVKNYLPSFCFLFFLLKRVLSGEPVKNNLNEMPQHRSMFSSAVAFLGYIMTQCKTKIIYG